MEGTKTLVTEKKETAATMKTRAIAREKNRALVENAAIIRTAITTGTTTSVKNMVIISKLPKVSKKSL